MIFPIINQQLVKKGIVKEDETKLNTSSLTACLDAGFLAWNDMPGKRITFVLIVF